ncbi:uncharacterized protein T551_00406 [Pneumocystis jirovecii RU7]|uniref:Sister chromatid cohesion protein n=1 Tax=Pneumocystis jirovecii (strain RU7) TaxID=1408657 RepID=A0A0W4ZVC7_PNEJ7|nr:uncharacterized protein T551_00406 [Pneumocystis jirovecii RU7]KTW32315.1 hypothetical protein T551_00406 [Pneumocystis jirovecii RU7]
MELHPNIPGYQPQEKYIEPGIPQDISEALQHSPLASVVSVEPLLQTIPQLRVNSNIDSVLRLSDEEIHASRVLISSWNSFDLNKNKEILSPTLKEITSLLKEMPMKKWSFKMQERTDNFETQYQDYYAEPSKLGAFARTLVDQCTVDVKYPSPVTPTQHILQKKTSSVEEQSFRKKIEIPIDFRTKTPEKYPTDMLLTHPWTPQSNTIPHTPTSKNSKRQIPSSGRSIHKSKRFVNIFDDEEYSNALNDQLKGERAIEQLQNVIQFIFEAEDAMVPDTSRFEAQDLYTSCWIDQTVPFDALCLNMEILAKLDTAIRKVCSMHLMSSLPVDMLSRLIKICSRSINESELITLTKQSFETNSYEKNLSLITKIGSSIYSLIILMKILTSEQLSKQLYSEDILIEMAHFLKSTLDNVIYVLADIELSKESSLLKFKKSMNMILYNVTDIIEYFGHLINLIEIPDSVITRLEFLCIPAIFIENLTLTKDHLFNNQGLEALKVASMNIIQKIYTRYPDQRMFILDEILTSLIKLPINKQQARRYKLVDGKSIQLVSALIMKLIQSCANSYKTNKEINIYQFLEKDIDHIKNEFESDLSTKFSSSELLETVLNTSSQYMDSVTIIANHVISFLLSRATKISKDNNFSHKILLDIFIEDLLSVLPLPSWPSCELLLKLTVTKLLNYIDNDKECFQTKGLSLDLLGNIASKIRFFSQISMQFVNSLSKDNVLSKFSLILQIGNFSFEKLEDLENIFQLHLLILKSFEFQNSEESKDHNMIQYSWLRWIYFIKSLKQKYISQSDFTFSNDHASKILKLVYFINILDDKTYNGSDFFLDKIFELYILYLSIYSLYQLFDAILSRILRCLDNNQVSIRTKALRSLGLIVNNDFSILSNIKVRQHVTARIADISSQVREVAIDLVGKYAISQKEIGQQYYSVLSERIAVKSIFLYSYFNMIKDTGLNVRKRVIKFLKDFYVISDNREIQIDIGRKLIQRLCDEEDTIKDLSAKTIEEIWFSTQNDLNEENIASIKYKKAQITKISIFQDVIENLRDEDRYLFKIFLRKISASKNINPSNSVFLSFINLMFDMLLDYHQNQDTKMLEKCLNTIIIFSEACPKLFSSSQLINIQPYLNGLKSSQEQIIFFYTVIIYRNVLPHISSIPKKVMINIQKILLSQLTKLPAKILNEVVPCLSIIANLLGDYERVGKIMLSCIKAIEPYKTMLQDKREINDDKKLILLLLLLGLFGRYCNFDKHYEFFSVSLNLKTDTSVAKFLIDTISIFFSLSSNIHISIQKVALHSIGTICIAHSKFFLYDENLKIMNQVLEGKSIELQNTLLSIFYDFLSIEEKECRYAFENEKNTQLLESKSIDINITENMKKIENDGISISLMQRYLSQILEISMNEDAKLSIVAIKILEIIITNGIANPRTCIPVIVALEISSNKLIRDIAIKIHLEIHEKHESLVEGCYIDSVKMAFQYQTRIKHLNSDDNSECLLIFLYNIIKQNRQGRKKFLIGLTKILDIDMSQINLHNNEDISFSKFLIQNLASFEYSTIEEVQCIIYTTNRILSTTGMSLYQQIEMKEFKFEDHDIIRITIASAQMLALVLLKKYLKESYGLTEQKCRFFDPNRLGNSKDNKPANKLLNISLNLDLISNITNSTITKNLSEKIIQSFYDIISNDDVNYMEFMETSDEHNQIENENKNGIEISDKENEIINSVKIKKNKVSKRKTKLSKNSILKKKHKHNISTSSE